MDELLAHATTLGVSVATASLPGPMRGVYDHEAGLVVFDHRLTPVERRCVLAHELGHAFHGHEMFGDPGAEDAADLYAAQLLISPVAYAAAERLDSSVGAIAEELGVEVRLVRLWRDRVVRRMSGVTYVRPRLGVGQWDWRFG